MHKHHALVTGPTKPPSNIFSSKGPACSQSVSCTADGFARLGWILKKQIGHLDTHKHTRFTVSRWSETVEAAHCKRLNNLIYYYIPSLIEMLVVTAVRDFKHWATSVEYLQRLYLETEVQSLAQANSVSSCLSGCRSPSDHCNTVDVHSPPFWEHMHIWCGHLRHLLSIEPWFEN